MEVVADFLFLGSKILADGDHCHEIRRQLLLCRKAVTNLDIVLKSRNITLLARVHIVKAIVFPLAPMQPPLLGRGVALLGHRP